MPINTRYRAKIQGYIPVQLKKRMLRVMQAAPYFTLSTQVLLALEARMSVMEDRVGIKRPMK